jgi:Asp/Glu/hydantoin racemase
MRAAASGGRRFSILTLGAAMGAPILRRAAALGVSAGLAELRILPFSIAEMIADRDARFTEIAEAAGRCEGDVVLLAGAPFAGLAERLARETGREALDGVTACVDEVRRLIGSARESGRA